MKKNTLALTNMIRNVATHEVDFYRNRWGTEQEFEMLPLISRDDFIETPLSHRRYKDQGALVKIVHAQNAMFLSEWAFEDIAKEEWGIPSKRPMVYFTDGHEAIEKSLWCYERGMVPLIGEKDPDIASYAASKYEVDSLITDESSLAKLTLYLKSRSDALQSISIVGDVFQPEELQQYREYAKTVRLVMRLPEIGAFAHAQLDSSLSFRPLPLCILEEKDGTVVVTKNAPLVTPVIRFQTSIPATMVDYES